MTGAEVICADPVRTESSLFRLYQRYRCSSTFALFSFALSVAACWGEIAAVAAEAVAAAGDTAAAAAPTTALDAAPACASPLPCCSGPLTWSKGTVAANVGRLWARSEERRVGKEC